MKEWIINKEDGVKLVEDVSQRADGQVKVKIAKVAISSHDVCNLFAMAKDDAVVPGHSAVALVSEADEDSGLKLGSRVVVSPYLKSANTAWTW